MKITKILFLGIVLVMFNIAVPGGSDICPIRFRLKYTFNQIQVAYMCR